MKYKFLAFLIALIFLLSCFNGVFAHPGHGSEYDIEEVPSSSSPSQPAPSSDSDSNDSSSSSGGSSSPKSGSSSSSSSNHDGGTSDSSIINDSDNVSEVNSSSDNQVEEDSLFSITNIILILAALVIGFVAMTLILKFFK